MIKGVDLSYLSNFISKNELANGEIENFKKAHTSIGAELAFDLDAKVNGDKIDMHVFSNNRHTFWRTPKTRKL